jgi:transposase
LIIGWLPRVEAPGQARKVAMIGALDFAAGKLVVETSRHQEKQRLHRPAGAARRTLRHMPATKPVVLVVDNGPIHTSKASRAALEARPWLTVEWLPKYAPS